ncbi:hypothetical protein KP509_1Z149400 [Ceratopteris richardii]|nr:hypothetical protein KP509_1Z149400 [Ceratopteris richardii]
MIQPMHDSTKTFEGIFRDHKTRMCKDAYSAMASSMSTTYSFLKILHSITNNFPNYDKADLGRMLKGPYSEDLRAGGGHYGFYSQVPNFRSHTDHDDYSSNSGSVTKVVVREWNSIDAMQFIYDNWQGPLAGNANGGQRHDIDVRGRLLNGLDMGFSSGVLASVQILCSDGISSSSAS